MSGETISAADGHLVIDGAVLTEPWLPRSINTPSFPPTSIADGYLFVLGDNRSDSMDSRTFGAVPLTLIDGIAVEVVSPPDRTKSLDPNQ